ncbi:VOC family protein [Pseudonocardia kujensis]|uniref:VOC family protein n=1 Tax=Pseudonocardia kujensis TaxID=1128675 RepID=UPI001E3F9B01|nr:VOC family protein [Pseudonocardia kujensis]MCE0765470.1 VOC family protein [Pseudonocardia kujensis]
MLELDHLIAFLPGPPDPPDGLLLDAGTRHVGQGTRNRRVVFPRHYVELLWIDEPEAERASGLGFAQRCARTAYPFGIVLRGTVPEGPFRRYTVPDGPTLAVHEGDPGMPFLAVAELSDAQLAGLSHPATPPHPNGAGGIVAARMTGAVPPGPVLPGLSLTPDGAPSMRVLLDSGPPLVLT